MWIAHLVWAWCQHRAFPRRSAPTGSVSCFRLRSELRRTGRRTEWRAWSAAFSRTQPLFKSLFSRPRPRARRDEGASPQGGCDRGATKPAALGAKTLRAAGLLPLARVGSFLTARCGDARNSPPGPSPKSLAAGPLPILKQALRESPAKNIFAVFRRRAFLAFLTIVAEGL